MLRFVAVMMLVAAVWGLSLALPSTDEQSELMTVLGISAKGDPDAFRKIGVAKGVIPLVEADDHAGDSAKSKLVAAQQDAARSSAKNSTWVSRKSKTIDAITAEVTFLKSAGASVNSDGAKQKAAKPVDPALLADAISGAADAASGSKIELARLDQDLRSGEAKHLTMRLQQQLRRVGCYGGKINGMWSTGTRSAMAKFNSRIDAELPIDEPDYVLLTLVEKFEDRACGIACGSGQIPDARGVCVARAVLEGDDAEAVVASAPELKTLAKQTARSVIASSALPVDIDEPENSGKTAVVVVADAVEPAAAGALASVSEPGKSKVEKPVVSNLVVDALVSQPVEVAQLDTGKGADEGAADVVAEASQEQPAVDQPVGRSANEFAVVIPASDSQADEVRILASSKARKLASRAARNAERAKQDLVKSFSDANVVVDSEAVAADVDQAVPHKRRIVELSRALDDQPVVRKTTAKPRTLRSFSAPRFSLGVRPARIQRARLRAFRADRVVIVKRRFVTRYRKKTADWKVKVFMTNR